MNLSTFEQFKTINPDGGVALNDDLLKRVQNVLGEMLQDITAYCDALQLDWCVCGGTCLGTIRQKGFIPWDDDIDIFMSRASFEKFRQTFKNNFRDKYCLHTPETHGFGLDMGRIRLKDTVYKGMWDIELDDIGFFIDIFILDNVPNNQIARIFHGTVSLFLGLIQSCSRFYRYRNQIILLAKGNSTLERTTKTKAMIGKFFSFKSMEQWCQIWDKWNSKYSNRDTKIISCPAGRLHYFGEMYPKEDMFPASIGTFESISVKVPANAAYYLNTLYGPDYMTPPPQDSIEKHVILGIEFGSK